jgi:CelD/BcsL family acetyltransferase involved in cellulose biosynthesis
MPKHDAIHLRDMPKHILGFANPLASLRQFRSDNTSHFLQLSPDYDTLYSSKRSAESRRSIRKRDSKLEALGKLEFGLPEPGEESHMVLREMFNDQEIRLAEAGVHGVFRERERRFIHTLMDSSEKDHAELRPYRLTLDGKSLSVMLGGVYNGVYWALISSLASGEFRKHSPGDRALRSLIAALCEDRLTYLDFSPGDSPYKMHWIDESVPLFHLIRAANLRGLPAAAFLLFFHATKRVIKANTFLKFIAYGTRKILSGRT